MRVLHVITGMQKAAGTSVFCGEVANGLVAAGHEVTIAVVDPQCQNCHPLDPRVKLVSISSLLTTNHYALTTNHSALIHIHGLWSGLLHRTSAFARENKIPVVWSTHGMTAPWSMRHKWWKKIPAWWLYQKWDLKSAAAIHCTTEKEVEWNRRHGFSNCFVAPLGTNESLVDSGQSLVASGDAKVLLFVGRIYPVKGLMNLIRAWGLVVSRRSLVGSGLRWKVRIVGPDQAGHRAELEKLIEELGVGDSVEFAGPKFGDELGKEYDNCDCLVLPSFTENFGVTIVDALAHGKPCIASTFTPWKELEDHGCGWWVSNSPESLSTTILEMMSLSDAERHEMGDRGRKLVDASYTWDAVVGRMIAEYAEVLAVECV